jgi:CheY-like chemotaxis protein
MSLRVLIFDDDQAIRRILWSFFDKRGYEVFTFPHPAICPLSGEQACPCPVEQSCTDVILSDLHMPVQNGLLFLEEQIKKGCRCQNFALMSGLLSDADISKAESLGIKLFEKPFNLQEIQDWLEGVEKSIDSRRNLSNWFITGNTPPSGR